MKNITNCVSCGNEFPYRKGKKYCSNSCRTAGYNERKNGNAEQDFLQQKQGYKTFFISDYSSFKDKDQCSLEQFCFLTKNFPTNEPVESLHKAVEYFVFYGSFLDDVNNDSHPVKRVYFDFIEQFHKGEFQIKNSRNY